MSLSKEAKQEIINSFKTHETDTGSPEVQIAILTNRINELTEHLWSINGITTARALQNDRTAQGLLNYLQKKDIERYRNLIERLGLRR